MYRSFITFCRVKHTLFIKILAQLHVAFFIFKEISLETWLGGSIEQAKIICLLIVAWLA